ncbi:hypothetical protein D6D28_06904 [Aureobasidium pullulans]|uniref:Zn(2)-C6 fungal-type domain-containing protein n=1 Tax=Aureobasidium pullulans TaxID=5580 RepID=A0A4S8SCK9_AURPU|nr:hypothetical protein D6D28_06904 [Aureobasidium pullulans]
MPMSASASRKNGKQASCEPCRRGKVRCDHHVPTCDRCRRRNMSSECYYHPAPLTRPSKRMRLSSLEDDAVDTAGTVGQAGSVATILPRDDTCVDAGGRQADLETRLHSIPDANATPPTTLPLLSLQSLDDTSARFVPATAVYDDRGNETLEGDLLSIIQILELLEHSGIIRKLVLEYYRLGQIAVVPSQLVLPVLSDLEQLHENILHQRAMSDDAACRSTLRGVAQTILHATKSKSPITSATPLAEFRGFYSGPNLRVETIGLIFTMAARASRLGLTADTGDNHYFVQAMFQCSARCLHLARELATEMSDVMVWLSYENLRLTTSIQGYAGPNVWRRLGDLSTDIFALEIHREAVITKAPFFLAECRRRVFTAAFHWDKFLATLFGRPPRIPSYYADCRPPLELTDDQLCLTGLSEEERASYERYEGWSTKSSSCSTTWIRALYLLAKFKDETLLHHHKPVDDKTRSKLEELANRCKQTWGHLPSRVHYDSACWKSDLAPISCLRLAEVYLTYLQTLFHIYRLMEKPGGNYSSELVQTCSSIIETTLQIGGFHDQAVYHLHNSFRASIVLCYGLPSAITLMNALKTAKRTMHRARFADLVRLVSIRRLSVFVTFLEGVYRPENANYALCIKASGLISSALDEIIEYLLLLAANDTIRQPDPGLTGNFATGIQDPISSDGMAAMGNADNDSLGDPNLLDWDTTNFMDMNNWMEGIDWTNASGGV